MNSSEEEGNVFMHRPPLLIDLFYLVTAHAQFPSETAKILGWLLLRLNEATHLIHRPRKFILPEGREVDSIGRDYSEDVTLDTENLVVEKVSLALVDDLCVGDAINMFSLHEAPYRPFLTYRARIAIDGPLIHMPNGTTVRMPRAKQSASNASLGNPTRSNGRPLARPALPKMKSNPGPQSHFLSRDFDNDYDN
jgi:hypothetical protein